MPEKNEKRPFLGPNEYSHPCSQCHRKFNKIFHLNYHMKKEHGASKIIKEYSHPCNQCHRKFNKAFHLKYHMKQKHGAQSVSAPKNVLASESVHPKSVHEYKKVSAFENVQEYKNNSASESVQKSQCIPTPAEHLPNCPLCKILLTKKDMLIHFDVAHDIKVDCQTLVFDNFDLFCEWKDTLEKDTKSKYNTVSQKTRGNKKYLYYECHRSGVFMSSGEGKRHLKLKGSNKIGGFCPASIKVHVTQSGQSEVKFCPVHIGHEKELGHLPLTSKERSNVASKIAAGIPFEKILDNVRDSISDAGLERLHLLSRKDLHNIKKSFNLCCTSIRHSDDSTSVDAWVKEMQEDNNCVLFYKTVGNIDSFPDACINENNETQTIVENLNKEKSQPAGSLEVGKGLLLQDFKDALGRIATLEELAIAKDRVKSIDPAVQALRESMCNSQSFNNLRPPNKKIKLQRSFNCKKKTTKRTLSKPSSEESQNIALTLLLKNKDKNSDPQNQ